LVFFAILAIRPRLCSVHIKSLNHSQAPNKTPAQTDFPNGLSEHSDSEQGEVMFRHACAMGGYRVEADREPLPLRPVPVVVEGEGAAGVNGSVLDQ
jgi:hypothetical protein